MTKWLIMAVIIMTVIITAIMVNMEHITVRIHTTVTERVVAIITNMVMDSVVTANMAKIMCTDPTTPKGMCIRKAGHITMATDINREIKTNFYIPWM
uniref:Uncharacterized protein n=1 Tax=Anopheles minimus TaxID=112268 RepID=A0A182WI13_9DIPT